MTDINDWPSLIHKEQHVMVPLNEYQMANLVDALAQVPNTGDWWAETLRIIYVAMTVNGIDALRANSGRTFTLDQIERQGIRLPKSE